MRLQYLSLVGAAALAITSPAYAAKTVRSTLPPPGATTNSLTVTSACDTAIFNPAAIACTGYFEGNLINGSPEDIANAQSAIGDLPGDVSWDGNWADVEATVITSLVNGNVLDFGTTLFGLTVIGAHFGNVDGDAGNVSGFWLFDFGTEGASSIVLDHPEGFSNAAIYATSHAPAVPEAGTWAMMLVGFGAAGFALRRKRRHTFMQLA